MSTKSLSFIAGTLSLVTVAICITILVLYASRSDSTVSPTVQTSESKSISDNSAFSSTAQYMLFTLNTKDFMNPAKSAAVVNRMMDIHEKYSVPFDVYLDHAIFQEYLASYPELLERLKTSPVVAVSWHMRPPLPYAKNFDWLGLAQMSKQDIYNTIYRYETHHVDAGTGATSDDRGGLDYAGEVMGYDLPIAAMNTYPEVQSSLAQVFKDLGTAFTITQGRDVNWGDKREGLLLRPEDEEIKFFEYDGENPEELIAQTFATAHDDPRGPWFVNLKNHDNDFIATSSAWLAVYLPYTKKGHELAPPFDLDFYNKNASPLDDATIERLWTLYERAVRYVSEHRDLYTPVNAFDFMRWIGKPVSR